MSEGGYRHIPLVDDDGRPVGMVSIRDLVDFLVELFPEKVHCMPPDSSKSLRWPVDGG
jgi:CBS domain-containing protein